MRVPIIILLVVIIVAMVSTLQVVQTPLTTGRDLGHILEGFLNALSEVHDDCPPGRSLHSGRGGDSRGRLYLGRKDVSP